MLGDGEDFKLFSDRILLNDERTLADKRMFMFFKLFYASNAGTSD